MLWHNSLGGICNQIGVWPHFSVSDLSFLDLHMDFRVQLKKWQRWDFSVLWVKYVNSLKSNFDCLIIENFMGADLLSAPVVSPRNHKWDPIDASRLRDSNFIDRAKHFGHLQKRRIDGVKEIDGPDNINRLVAVDQNTRVNRRHCKHKQDASSKKLKRTKCLVMDDYNTLSRRLYILKGFVIPLSTTEY